MHNGSLYHSPPSVSKLPGKAASLQACVWCCPMCTAEGADPRAGGGVQGARGGHGVCAKGSRNGHRRGTVGLVCWTWMNFTWALWPHCSACCSLSQCQHQFRNRRWNCSTTPRGINVFGRVMNHGMEKHLLISAGIRQCLYVNKRIFLLFCYGLRDSRGSLCARSVLGGRGSGCDPGLHTGGAGEVWLWQEGQGGQPWGWAWILFYANVMSKSTLLSAVGFTILQPSLWRQI